MSFNDPYDDFEKNMRHAKRDRKYDYRNLPGDVADITKAVAKSAAEAAGYVGRVLTAPLRFPEGRAMRKMVQKTKKEQDDAARKSDPYWRPRP